MDLLRLCFKCWVYLQSHDVWSLFVSFEIGILMIVEPKHSFQQKVRIKFKTSRIVNWVELRIEHHKSCICMFNKWFAISSTVCWQSDPLSTDKQSSNGRISQIKFYFDFNDQSCANWSPNSKHHFRNKHTNPMIFFFQVIC